MGATILEKRTLACAQTSRDNTLFAAPASGAALHLALPAAVACRLCSSRCCRLQTFELAAVPAAVSASHCFTSPTANPERLFDRARLLYRRGRTVVSTNRPSFTIRAVQRSAILGMQPHPQPVMLLPEPMPSYILQPLLTVATSRENQDENTERHIIAG